MNPKNNKLRVLIHNIRSTHNVGSIFRTSDALGVEKIYITGFSPTPLDKYKRPRKDVAKVSLGAEKEIPWEYRKNPIELIKKVKKEGFKVVGIEQATNSINYRDFKIKGPVLLIVGSEVEGIDKKILNLCDKILEIQMHGKKESLNVSVAFGVVAYSIVG